MSCFPQEVVLELHVHQNTKNQSFQQRQAYVKGKKKMVETASSKKPKVRNTGLSLQTPKRQRAPRGFLLGSLEAPRPMTKGMVSVMLTIHGDAHHQESHQPGVGHEEQIIVMVVNADTVVYPRAVVVEALHTHIAHGAVA